MHDVILKRVTISSFSQISHVCFNVKKLLHRNKFHIFLLYYCVIMENIITFVTTSLRLKNNINT